ncbi:MAG: hypothetical protein BroJett011_33720 [Chloroflexota bacterium]|nr:MAG: hypothetical protein BroJett011_33720 [Chloroflexota bacterium]
MEELTTTETNKLEILETVIEQGLQTFVEVGEALAEIRDSKLYRSQYDTFENYCRERWGISRPRAYELINAAEVVQNLSATADISPAPMSPIGDILPTSERQARPLTLLPPKQQTAAWQQAVETAPNGHVTASHVEQVVKQNFIYARDKPRITRTDNRYAPVGHDACQTPACAFRPLLPYLSKDWTLWEPARGEGNLERTMQYHNFNTVSGDIITGRNFLDYEPDRWDCQVTNPPWSIQFYWLERCYTLGKPFALLLKVDVLGTEAAQVLFEQYGVEVILVRPRINYKMPNTGWDGGGAFFASAWYTWGLNIGRQMTFTKLDVSEIFPGEFKK